MRVLLDECVPRKQRSSSLEAGAQTEDPLKISMMSPFHYFRLDSEVRFR